MYIHTINFAPPFVWLVTKQTLYSNELNASCSLSRCEHVRSMPKGMFKRLVKMPVTPSYGEEAAAKGRASEPADGEEAAAKAAATDEQATAAVEETASTVEEAATAKAAAAQATKEEEGEGKVVKLEQGLDVYGQLRNVAFDNSELYELKKLFLQEGTTDCGSRESFNRSGLPRVGKRLRNGYRRVQSFKMPGLEEKLLALEAVGGLPLSLTQCCLYLYLGAVSISHSALSLTQRCLYLSLSAVSISHSALSLAQLYLAKPQC